MRNNDKEEHKEKNNNTIQLEIDERELSEEELLQCRGGTRGAGQVDDQGGQNTVALLQDPAGAVGQVAVLGAGGSVEINQSNFSGNAGSGFQPPPPPADPLPSPGQPFPEQPFPEQPAPPPSSEQPAQEVQQTAAGEAMHAAYKLDTL